MSERFQEKANAHASKNTRLPIAQEFANYRFGRDALAHLMRYLWVCEQWIDRKRPLKVLDIGCGDIYTARTLVASFVVKKTDVIREYVGLDLDSRSLARSRATLPQSMPIRLVHGDITNGALKQFKDDAFDMVVCLETLEHIQPEFVPVVLREIARLAPEAILSTPNWTGGSGSLPKDHVKEWDTDELAAEMDKAGLKVLRRIGFFCNLPKAKKLAENNALLKAVYTTAAKTMPADLLSLTMAHFLGSDAQNVLYDCRRK